MSQSMSKISQIFTYSTLFYIRGKRVAVTVESGGGGGVKISSMDFKQER